MKVNEVFDIVRVGARVAGRQTKRHLPEIIFVVAVGCIIKGAKEASKAGAQWEATLDMDLEELDEITVKAEEGQITEKEAAIETFKVHGKIVSDCLKCNWKAIAWTGAGIVATGFDLHYLKKENRSLEKALMDSALVLGAYRGRVRDRLGEQEEYDLFHNIKRKLVEEEYVDENGKKKKRMVEEVDTSESVSGDHNSFFFGQGDVHFNDMASNVTFFDQTEEMFNRMLVGRGDYGCMNRAEMFRFFKTKDRFPAESQRVGAIYIKAEDEAGNYEHPYPDPTIPRIVKITTSKEFGVSTGETWVDINCIPLNPILERKEKEIISGFGKRTNGKYIATI